MDNKQGKSTDNMKSETHTMVDKREELNKYTKQSVDMSKEGLSISTKIVESGINMVEIHNELSHNESENVLVSCTTKEVIAESKFELNKFTKNGESGKQFMMDNKETKTARGIEKSRLENEKEESDISLKIVESGKQMVVINNELTKIKTVVENGKQTLANEKEELNQTLKSQESDKQILTKKKQKASENGELLKNNEKSNITRKIIESGKQFLGINNKLTMPNNDMTKNLKESDVELNIKDVAEPSDKQKVGEEDTNEKDGQQTKTRMDNPICLPEPDKTRLREKFKLFSKFGDKSSDGSSIKLSQSEKWFKQAGVIKPKGISTTDTAIAFRKVSKRALKLSFAEWNQYLSELARAKKMDVNTIKTQLVECEEPGCAGAKKEARVVAVGRVSHGSRSGRVNKQDSLKEHKKENLRRGWRL